MKYVREVRERFASAMVFTLSDLRVLLKEKKISNAYLLLLVHKLKSRGEILKISRGAYTFIRDAEVVGFAFRPFYYGLQEALSIMNLWEQETNPVVITPRKVRAGVRVFSGGNFLVRRISRKMFFGFEMLRYGNFWIPVSDPEKTLIDFAYFRLHLDNGALKAISKRIRKGKLREYLRRCPPWVVKRVRTLLRDGS